MMWGAPGRFAGALLCAFAQFALLLYCAYTQIGQNNSKLYGQGDNNPFAPSLLMNMFH